MYLIDTSVWIDYFRMRDTNVVRIFNTLLEKELPFGITGVIFQEILQGADSEQDLKKLSDYLATQYFFNPKDNVGTYRAAAELYYSCRRRGITIRSTIDCLIAQIAIEHNLILLHNDKDFELIQKVNKKLKLH